MKIVLVGDSIMFGSPGCLGYGAFVKEYFEDKRGGSVCFPYENCQDSGFTASAFDALYDLDEIADADVVHWNNGLWDTLHLFGNPRPRSPLNLYLERLDRVLAKIKLFCPNAKVIFATTTPVIEEKYGKTYRKNEEIEEYNKAVIEHFSSTEVIVNPLGEYAKSCLLSIDYIAEDGTHYNDKASELLSKKVIEAIEKVL